MALWQVSRRFRVFVPPFSRFLEKHKKGGNREP